MILRVLTLVGGIAGGVGASQLPEFSQQYVQRLGGAVDALAQVVEDFDASAAAEGLSRDTALAQMNGTAFLDRRRADMQRSFDRYEKLSDDLKTLQGQGPFSRAYLLPGLTDRQVVQATWQSYQPAVPVTAAGGIFAALGFLVGGIGFGALGRGAAALLRRRVRAGAA